MTGLGKQGRPVDDVIADLIAAEVRGRRTDDRSTSYATLE